MTTQNEELIILNRENFGRLLIVRGMAGFSLDESWIFARALSNNTPFKVNSNNLLVQEEIWYCPRKNKLSVWDKIQVPGRYIYTATTLTRKQVGFSSRPHQLNLVYIDDL
jgi:hypothetical protein